MLKAFRIAFDGVGSSEVCLLVDWPGVIAHTASFAGQSSLMKARVWREFKTMASWARDLAHIR